jgi:hypothetical protein
VNFACVRAGLIVAALIFPCVSTAEEDRVWPRGTYTVQIETERIANTDRHYTNGIRFAWISDRHENGPDWSKDLLEMLYPFADLRAGRVGETAAGSHEVRGKTLRIIGYGNIGSQIAVLAESMGLRVIYHDHTDKLRHVNAEPAASIDDLLTRSDIVTLHVPETPATDRMIGAAEIARMKDGAFLINNSRGTVVNLDALATALQSRKLGGAAIDVFPVEPFHLASARCTKRHPDAACGRLHGRSPRAYRRRGHPQINRVFRCGIDRGCRELSTSTALPSARSNTLYSGATEQAQRTR